MAYFDNAATTYPKPDKVYSFMDEFYRENGANAGRGNYGIALSAGELISDTRKRIKNLLHCPSKQVIFQPTATISLNIVIQGIIKLGARNIYISPFEHNAVTRTLNSFDKEGKINIHQLNVSSNMEFDLKRIKYQFDEVKPDFLIISHASNAFGLIAPIQDICILAKKYNAYTLIDMSQTAGMVDCNIGLDIYDFAVFAGHKTLYGPTGVSGFVMNPEVELQPIIFGGTGYESANQDMPESLPERFEVGTTNIVGIAGLNAALQWIEENSIEAIHKREKENRMKLLTILEEFEFITIVGNYEKQKYVGIVSCLIDRISSDIAGNIFAQCNVAVRTGLHCAPLAHKFMNTYPAGTIRFSVSYFTTDEDFIELKEALEYIEENL